MNILEAHRQSVHGQLQFLREARLGFFPHIFGTKDAVATLLTKPVKTNYR